MGEQYGRTTEKDDTARDDVPDRKGHGRTRWEQAAGGTFKREDRRSATRVPEM